MLYEKNARRLVSILNEINSLYKLPNIRNQIRQPLRISIRTFLSIQRIEFWDAKFEYVS